MSMGTLSVNNRCIVARKRILELIRASFASLSSQNKSVPCPPSTISEEMLLSDLGLDQESADSFTEEMKRRTGIRFEFRLMLACQCATSSAIKTLQHYVSVEHMACHIESGIMHAIRTPMLVYVDNSEENLFRFHRKYQERFNVRTFVDPIEAREFILKKPQVVLVLASERMLEMNASHLQDSIHMQKPFMKIILIAQNRDTPVETTMKCPSDQERFYGVLKSPLDLEGKGEEYFSFFNGILSGDFF